MSSVLDVTVAELFEQQVRASPHAPAVLLDGGGALSFRDLNVQANRRARQLRALGVGPEVALTHASVWVMNDNISARYMTSEEHDGPALCVACDGSVDAELWRRVLTGPLSLHYLSVKGDGESTPHMSMFDRHNVALFTPLVEEFLARLDRTPSAGDALAAA